VLAKLADPAVCGGAAVKLGRDAATKEVPGVKIAADVFDIDIHRRKDSAAGPYMPTLWTPAGKLAAAPAPAEGGGPAAAVGAAAVGGNGAVAAGSKGAVAPGGCGAAALGCSGAVALDGSGAVAAACTIAGEAYPAAQDLLN